MKRAGGIAGLALLLVLTGCAAGGAGSTGESAPLTAESPSAEGDGAAAFLADVRAALPDNTVIPDATDEQLLAAGETACEKLAAGDPSDQISVIEGEEKNGADLFADSSVIVTAARDSLC